MAPLALSGLAATIVLTAFLLVNGTAYGQASAAFADAGESAYAGQSLAPTRLASTPVLLDRDLSLSNRAFNFNIYRP